MKTKINPKDLKRLVKHVANLNEAFRRNIAIRFKLREVGSPEQFVEACAKTGKLHGLWIEAVCTLGVVDANPFEEGV